MCKNQLSPTDSQFIKQICLAHGNKPDELINILHKVQQHFGFLPPPVQQAVACELSIPVSKVYGVVTFYSLFTMEPKGRYPVSICTGTACHVRGSGDVVREVERVLGIKVGQTTADGKFSLNTLRCVGACGLAPVVMIGEQIHGRVEVRDIEALLGAM